MLVCYLSEPILILSSFMITIIVSKYTVKYQIMGIPDNDNEIFYIFRFSPIDVLGVFDIVFGYKICKNAEKKSFIG